MSPKDGQIEPKLPIFIKFDGFSLIPNYRNSIVIPFIVGLKNMSDCLVPEDIELLLIGILGINSGLMPICFGKFNSAFSL